MTKLPQLPGYELLKCLGGGPLTCVWTARDYDTDSLCAVKMLRPEWQDHPTAIKLLQREARAGLKVRHPHVVGLQHVHVTRPPYFLVMDMLGGEPLRRRLQRSYRLDTGSALWIIRQTAEALAALHRHGFIHGDVKPDNILLIDDGNAILIDLGFAHRPGENTAFFEQGYILGTVNYLAPEQCAAEPQADLSSDIFSLGVTLFETLSGQLPYPTGPLEETMQRHLNDPPENIRRAAAHIPNPLANLVDRMLAQNPASRPKAAMVVQQLIALEILSLGQRKIA